MQNIKWLFFDLGSTLIDESECIKKRCDVICESNNIDREENLSAKLQNTLKSTPTP